MSQPKKRVSTARRNNRRYSFGNKIPTVTAMACSNCNETKRPHTVCSRCGHYDGKAVFTVKAPKTEVQA